MRKQLWKGSFEATTIPAYPCPSCPVGKLKKNKNDLITRRPRDPSFDVYEESPQDWPSRFALFLKCGSCAEIVVVTGVSVDGPEELMDGSVEWVEYLQPEGMWPAPPIISTRKLPKPVRLELEKSFGFYWIDAGACASRMRTSLERLMDHFKVPSITIVTDKAGKKSRKRLDLSPRIDKFAKKIRSRQYSDMLHALRVVGNVGTHGKKTVTKADLLDAYRVYEFALERMFEDKNESIKETLKRLLKLK